MTQQVHDEETHDFLERHMVNEDDFFVAFFSILWLVPQLIFALLALIYHGFIWWITVWIVDSPWSNKNPDR